MITITRRFDLLQGVLLAVIECVVVKQNSVSRVVFQVFQKNQETQRDYQGLA